MVGPFGRDGHECVQSAPGVLDEMPKRVFPVQVQGKAGRGLAGVESAELAGGVQVKPRRYLGRRRAVGRSHGKVHVRCSMECPKGLGTTRV